MFLSASETVGGKSTKLEDVLTLSHMPVGTAWAEMWVSERLRGKAARVQNLKGKSHGNPDPAAA